MPGALALDPDCRTAVTADADADRTRWARAKLLAGTDLLLDAVDVQAGEVVIARGALSRAIDDEKTGAAGIAEKVASLALAAERLGTLARATEERMRDMLNRQPLRGLR